MLKLVKLTNYRQFSSKEVVLDSKLHIIQGRNATGKSTVVEAIAYALQGSVVQKGKGGSWVKEGESNGGVDLYLDDIVISRHTNKQVILDSDGNIIARGHTGLNEYIERRYKLVPELFKTSFYIGQKDVDSFAGLTPMERTKRVEKLLRIDVLDNIKTEVSNTAKVLKADIANITAKLASAVYSEDQISTLEAQIAKAQKSHDSLLEQLNTAEREDAIYQEAILRWTKMLQIKSRLSPLSLEDLTAKLALLDTELEKANKASELNRLYEEKLSLEKKLAGISINEDYFKLSISQVMNHKAVLESNKKLQEKLIELQDIEPIDHENLEQMFSKLSALKHDFATLEGSPETCKTCGQKMPDMKDRAKRLKELKSSIDQLESEFKLCSSQSQKYKLMAAIQTIELDLTDNIDTIIATLEAKPYYERLKAIGDVAYEDCRPVNDIKKDIQETNDGLTNLAIFAEYADCTEEPKKVDLNGIKQQVKSSAHLLTNYQSDLSKLNQAKSLHDMYKEDLLQKENKVLTYSKLIKFIDSYRKEFSDNIIPLLSDNVTKIMSYLSEGKYDKVSIGKDYSIENYDMLSGSEEDSVNFALRLAIAQISRLGDFNTMMLDEIAASFDSTREGLLLDILKSTDMQLIYISHGDLQR